MRLNGVISGLTIVACCSVAAYSPVSGDARNSTAGATRAASSPASSYPDWAAAVVPPYPHALPSSGLITPKLYGIATTDPLPTVVAWYKSRVHGAWSESEGGNTWAVKSGGLRIQISANYYDESGEEKPGTRVALTRYP